ncbi:MAG: ester cyclase [Chloroflexi bacterium]|nr:ester cyclase [Chloroflexota bacterium]
MPRANEQIVRELLEAWNAHDVERVAALHAPEYEGVDVGEAEPHRGPDGIRQATGRYLDAFPDLHFTVSETLAQGNRVALVWSAQGTHQGKLMNIPATGRVVTLRGVTLLTIAGGKITRSFFLWDVAGFLRAIRLLPEL